MVVHLFREIGTNVITGANRGIHVDQCVHGVH